MLQPRLNCYKGDIYIEPQNPKAKLLNFEKSLTRDNNKHPCIISSL